MQFLEIFFRILPVIIFRAMLIPWICCSLCLVLLNFFRTSSLSPFPGWLDSVTSTGKSACVYLLISLVAKTPLRITARRKGAMGAPGQSPIPSSLSPPSPQLLTLLLPPSGLWISKAIPTSSPQAPECTVLRAPPHFVRRAPLNRLQVILHKVKNGPDSW